MSIGKIIVFEGLDCSFKQSNAEMLKTYFEDNVPESKVALFSFPMYNEQSSFFVKEYLKGTYGKDPSEIGPELAAMFYMMDMLHTWKTKIEPLYNEGYIIIMDRFWQSNIYHQLSKVFNRPEQYSDPTVQSYINNSVVAMTGMATDLFKLPSPDFTFLMKMDFDNIVKLLEKKNSSNDIHESKLEYLKSVYNFYNLLTGGGNSTEIYCYNPVTLEIRTRGEIFSSILKALKEAKLDGTEKCLEDYTNDELIEMFTTHMD